MTTEQSLAEPGLVLGAAQVFMARIKESMSSSLPVNFNKRVSSALLPNGNVPAELSWGPEARMGDTLAVGAVEMVSQSIALSSHLLLSPACSLPLPPPSISIE